MDATQLAIRTHVLSTDLREALSGAFPETMFALDLARALVRPGEPIGLSWTDGPAPQRVLDALRPRWGGVGPNSYPVVCIRDHSPGLGALVVLRLLRCTSLGALLDAGRIEFAAALEQHFEGLSVPTEVSAETWAEALLFSELAARAVGRDTYTWARWVLTGQGRQVVADVLPAVLTTTQVSPQPTST